MPVVSIRMSHVTVAMCRILGSGLYIVIAVLHYDEVKLNEYQFTCVLLSPVCYE